MSKFLDSDSPFSVESFLDDPIFQDWVLRPEQALEDYWQQWIAQHPTSYPSIKEARRILLELNQASFSLDESDIQKIWKKIQLDVHPKQMTVVRKSIWQRIRRRWAAACVLAISSVALYLILSESSQQTIIRTGFGETRTISLPDGSEVILNANSLLVYQTTWNSNSTREVWVEGEAFFDVQHLDNHQPFKVYPVSGIEIEVLGTQFNVYQRNNHTKVMLSEGNVTMNFTENSSRSKILMTPGDLVEYDQEKIRKKRVNPVPYVSWTRKVLELDSTTLKEMIRMAEENYGVKIEVDTDVDLNQSASGSMPLTDGSSFMELTAKIFNVQVSYLDSIYYIR